MVLLRSQVGTALHVDMVVIASVKPRSSAPKTIRMPIKIQVLSDLHCEFRTQNEDQFFSSLRFDSTCRLGIVAGDLSVLRLPYKTVLRHFQRVAANWEAMFYVPGNHEYYGGTVAQAEAVLERLQSDVGNMCLLRTGVVHRVEGYAFVGDTMWFPETRLGNAYKHLLSDFSLIPDLTPWCYQQSQGFLEWLKQVEESSCVVITHHLPSDRSAPPIWRTSKTRPYFVNRDAEAVLRRLQPKLWIHGHTHVKCDYTIGRTRILCNPIGYPGENGEAPGGSQTSVFLLD